MFKQLVAFVKALAKPTVKRPHSFSKKYWSKEEFMSDYMQDLKMDVWKIYAELGLSIAQQDNVIPFPAPKKPEIEIEIRNGRVFDKMTGEEYLKVADLLSATA